MELRKIVAFDSIQKTSLDEIDVPESKKRAHRELSGQELEVTAKLHTTVLQQRWGSFLFQLPFKP
jgi:hypothetical protein